MTSKDVIAGRTAERTKRSVRRFFNPASGALEIRPDAWLEIEQAPRCDLCRIKLRVNLELAFLYSAKLRVQCRGTAQQILSYAFGFFP